MSPLCRDRKNHEPTVVLFVAHFFSSFFLGGGEAGEGRGGPGGMQSVTCQIVFFFKL